MSVSLTEPNNEATRQRTTVHNDNGFLIVRDSYRSDVLDFILQGHIRQRRQSMMTGLQGRCYASQYIAARIVIYKAACFCCAGCTVSWLGC